MDNHDFSNIGQQIKSMVQDAINTMDFKKLNQDIGSTVNSALNELREGLNPQGRGQGRKPSARRSRRRKQRRRLLWPAHRPTSIQSHPEAYRAFCASCSAPSDSDLRGSLWRYPPLWELSTIAWRRWEVRRWATLLRWPSSADA
ncbi:MAG: hypothetical protein ACLR23_17250 [Clostridia bacterium]